MGAAQATLPSCMAARHPRSQRILGVLLLLHTLPPAHCKGSADVPDPWWKPGQLEDLLKRWRLASRSGAGFFCGGAVCAPPEDGFYLNEWRGSTDGVSGG